MDNTEKAPRIEEGKEGLPEIKLPETEEKKVEEEITREEKEAAHETISGEEKQKAPQVRPVPQTDQQEEIAIRPKSEMQKKIESILSEDLYDSYQSMNEEQKKTFTAKGEAAARQIESLITSAKVKVKEVLSLIRDWLRLIPGVNQFFLEQESKIKTDKVLSLTKNKKS